MGTAKSKIDVHNDLGRQELEIEGSVDDDSNGQADFAESEYLVRSSSCSVAVEDPLILQRLGDMRD